MYLLCLSLFAKAQVEFVKSFEITSIESQKIAGTLSFDWVNQNIIVCVNNKKNCINSFIDTLENSRIINSKFILINFQSRGGSGVGIDRLVLLCFSKNKIYKSMDIISEVRTNYSKDEADSNFLGLYSKSELYKVTFEMKPNSGNRKIQIFEYDKSISQIEPTDNFEMRDTVDLFFDNKEKIFYSGFEILDSKYRIDSDTKALNKDRNFNSEKFPVIKLKDELYLFIDGEWYIKDDKNHLTLFSKNCD